MLKQVEKTVRPLGMAKRRKVVLDFPVVAADSAANQLADWRSGDFSDWTLTIDSEHYAVHRVVLSRGERSSAFLERAFSSDAYASTAAKTTDLSGFSSDMCTGSIFQGALDFAYKGVLPEDIAESAKDLVLLCKVVDALQMRALLSACVEKLNEPDVLSHRSAIGVAKILDWVKDLGSDLWAQLLDVVKSYLCLVGARSHSRRLLGCHRAFSWTYSLVKTCMSDQKIKCLY